MVQIINDIRNKQDIVQFVDQFYSKVMKDDILRPFFSDINLQNHLPKMVNFWSFVLLDEPGYTTDVTKVHINMPLTKMHFDRWIALFNETIDQHYAGPIADNAKSRAFTMRWTMESKIV